MNAVIKGIVQIAGGLVVGDLLGKGVNKLGKVASEQIKKVKASKKG